MPFVLIPSITPITPRPCSVSPTSTSTVLAVAQKIRQTSGTALTAFSTLIGKALPSRIRKTWPAPIAWALVAACAVNAGSVPLERTSAGPEASLKASPKRMPGTAPTSASCRSSTVLMKCAWPRIRLTSSAFSRRTTWICMVKAPVAAGGGRGRGRPGGGGVDVEGRQGGQPNAAARRQLGRHAQHGGIVGGLDDVDEVIRAEYGVLGQDLHAQLLQLGIDLFDTPGVALDRLGPLG